MTTPVPSVPIVLVDDEPQILRSYEIALRMAGFTNLVALSRSAAVMETLASRGAELVLLDLTMPPPTGEDLLESIGETHPDIPVVVITGTDAAATAVRCMKLGAADYLVKPISKDRLVTTVRHTMRRRELQRENRRLTEYLREGRLQHAEPFARIVTNNAAMHAVFRYAEAIAQSSQPVLITGETGVGKELLARAIHAASRRSGEFVPVNVAGVESHVLDDTLFGHVRGAFTGAAQARAGLVERSDRGTLFLDEIGDLPAQAQVKLLRLLQDGEFYPLGQDRPKSVDIRVLAATHRDLEDLQESGAFRRDLYFRVCAHRVRIPPLRQRLDDLPLLIAHFSAEVAAEMNSDACDIPQEAVDALAGHAFPGNVRELRSMVFDAIRAHGGLLQALPHMRLSNLSQDSVPASPQDRSLVFGATLPTIEDAKDLLIEEALRRTGGNKSLAAELLGVTRQALNKRQRQAKQRG
jgi:DNA-binding NtrC family response regulator